MDQPDKDRIRIEELEAPSAEAVQDLRRLLPQVSSSADPVTEEKVRAALAGGSHILLARLDGQIIGMTVLAVVTTLAGSFGVVEEVAVDEAVRGHHVSTALMRSALELASRFGLRHVDLTSRPSREVANHLYRSVGFVQRDTNCYRYECVPVVR